jgi:DNA polymerase/3'-5' exonuclease PolX
VRRVRRGRFTINEIDILIQEADAPHVVIDFTDADELSGEDG